MKPLWFDPSRGEINFLQQTLLPAEESWIATSSPTELVNHIKNLDIRGAPLLGLAGAWGSVLIRKMAGWTPSADWFLEDLRSVRPTAVDLSKGVDEVRKASSLDQALALAQSYELRNDTVHTSMAKQSRDLILGSSLTRPLFICNAGQLATGATYGSSTGGWQMLAGEGHEFFPIILETRPLLQGSRLTAWEFEKMGVDHTVTIDSNAANLMKSGQVDSVWLGADRVSSDGFVVNKVGSLSVALLARNFAIPVYVVAPGTTWDREITGPVFNVLKSMIENRDPSEITPWKDKVRYKHEKVLNPAFDIVPPALIARIVTA